MVADRNLVPHRERFEAAMPRDATVVWRTGPAGVHDELRDAQVYVGGRFTADMAGVAEKLRLIHVAGAGTDRIDVAALSGEVLVANTFHHERSIAEYVLAAAIMLRRGFLVQDRALRRDVWASAVYDDAVPQAKTLRDARVGLVGFGHIGQFAWDLFRAFGSTGIAVTGSGRVDAAAHGLSWVGDVTRLDELDARVRRRGGVGAVDARDGGHDRRRPTAGARGRRRADQRRPRTPGERTRAVRRTPHR